MTLTVEDGSVVTGAESYVTIPEFKNYCDARGISYSPLTDDDLEKVARKAFDYMIQKYRGLWKGYRKSAVQVGDWPRSFVYLEPFVHGAVGTYPFLVDEDTIPAEIKSGQIELMIRLNAGVELLPDSGRTESSITVGPISVSYERGAATEPQKYEVVDSLFRVYLSAGQGKLTGTVRRA